MTTTQALAGTPTPEGPAAQPATILTIHTMEHLPCPACTFGVRNGQLEALDWCADCGHFHVEMDCPIQRLAMTDLEALRFAMRDALLEAGAMYGVSFAGELDNVAEECVDVAIGWGGDQCWICDGEGISGLYRDGNPKICKRCQGSGKFNVPDEPTEDQIMDLMNAPSAAERRAEAITIQERLK